MCICGTERGRSSTVESRTSVAVEMSEIECTAELADNNGDCKCWGVVTGVMQPSTVFCVWNSPMSAQCSVL